MALISQVEMIVRTGREGTKSISSTALRMPHPGVVETAFQNFARSADRRRRANLQLAENVSRPLGGSRDRRQKWSGTMLQIH